MRKMLLKLRSMFICNKQYLANATRFYNRQQSSGFNKIIKKNKNALAFFKKAYILYTKHCGVEQW